MGVLRDPRGDRELPDRDMPGTMFWVLAALLLICLVAVFFAAVAAGTGQVSDEVEWKWEPTTGLSAPAHPGG